MNLSIGLALIVVLLYSGQSVTVPVCVLSLYLLLEMECSKVRALFLLSCTIIFSLACRPLYYATEFSGGFQSDNIARVTGYAVSVSTPGRFYQARFSLECLECNDQSGAVASARGIINATIPGNMTVLAGDLVVLDGKFSSYGFNARKAFIRRRPAYNSLRLKTLSFLEDRITGGSEDEKILSRMLLLGLSDDPDYPLTQLARESGTSYVLALSGMHIGFFSMLLGLLLKPLFGKRGARALSLLLLSLYVAVIGVKPSLVRALLLSFCFFTFPDNRGIENLALTLVLQTIILPGTVISLSAAFSYISLCGILGFSAVFKQRLDDLILLPEGVSSSLSASVSAILYTVPFTFSVFGSYQLTALLSGGVISALIYLYMLISVIGMFNINVDLAQGLIYDAIEWSMKAGASLPLQTTLIPYACFGLSVLLIMALSVILNERKRRACGILITTALRNLQACLKQKSLL